MHNVRQRPHGLLQRRVRVEAVMIEDVHIIDFHAAQACVEAAHEVLAAAAVAIRAVLHGVACFGGENQLVAVRTQVAVHDFPQRFFCRAGARAVVVCQVEVGDACVERRQQHVARGILRRD